MGEYSQSEFQENQDSLIARVLYNPDRETFNKKVTSSFSILDVGCGEKAYVSWELNNNNQIYVACDPLINEYSFKDSINKIERKKGNYIFFNKKAAELPEFQPNVISLVAPNQIDVIDGLFYDLDKFLGKKEQYLFAVLDTRTHAADRNKEALHEIQNWMKSSKFSEIYFDETEDMGEEIEYLEADLKLACHFSPKSGDLRSKNILIVGARNAK